MATILEATQRNDGGCSVNGFPAERLVVVDHKGFGVEPVSILPSVEAVEWFCAGWNLCLKWDDPQEAKSGAEVLSVLQVATVPSEVDAAGDVAESNGGPEGQSVADCHDSNRAPNLIDPRRVVWVIGQGRGLELVHFADSAEEAIAFANGFNFFLEQEYDRHEEPTAGVGIPPQPIFDQARDY